MKKFLILAMAVLMSGIANAQIVSSNSSRIEKTVTPKPASKDYNRIYFGYATLGYGGDWSKVDGMGGAKLGYLHGFNVMKNQPLYVEFGVEGQIDVATEPDMLSANFSIPLHLAYKYRVKKFWFEPYAGLSFRINAAGWTEINHDEYDWFDDMDGKRFQVGGAFGLNIGYKALNFNLGYQAYSPLFKEDGYKVSTNTFTVGLGINW